MFAAILAVIMMYVYCVYLLGNRSTAGLLGTVVHVNMSHSLSLGKTARCNTLKLLFVSKANPLTAGLLPWISAALGAGSV